MLNKKEIITLLNQNEIVCIPTDTVFGLAIKVGKANSIKLSRFKGSLEDKLFTIMVYSKEQALKLWEDNSKVKDLVEKHFPGDLTIIAKSKTGDNFIGVRVPKSKDILEIIKEVGPIYATSTNESGKAALNNVGDIKKTFPGVSILNGVCGNKRPSTIIKIEGDMVEMIRKGDNTL